MFKYVFGPVPSRRLGVSLGIDLVEAKTCNLNCIYCECGTNKKTYDCNRKNYVDIEVVKKELIEALKTIKPDYITFSGSGEPTLNNEIGTLIDWVKENTNIKVAIITNSTLLHKEEVRRELKNADIILPSLDAVSEEVFLKINRPHPSLKSIQVIEGIEEMVKEFKGEIFLEIFITQGINDSDEELERFVEVLKQLKVEGIQLNTLARPGAVKWIIPATFKRLEEIKRYFEKNGIKNVEVIKKYQNRGQLKNYSNSNENLMLKMLEKRSYTLEELEEVLGSELHKYLEILKMEKKVEVAYKNGTFYVEKL